MLVLPNEYGNTVTCGMIDSLKHKIIIIEQSIDIRIETKFEQLSKRIDALEHDRPSMESMTTRNEQLERIENEIAKRDNIVFDLQAKVNSTTDLPTLIERMNTRLDSVVPPVESSPKTDQQSVLRRRRSSKRRPRPLSDLPPEWPIRSNSVSSATSSGYKSNNVTHQDSIGDSQLANLSAIEEQNDISTQLPQTVTEQQSIDGGYIDNPDGPPDIEAVKHMVVDTLWYMKDLVEVLNRLGLDIPTSNKTAAVGD